MGKCWSLMAFALVMLNNAALLQKLLVFSSFPPHSGKVFFYLVPIPSRQGRKPSCKHGAPSWLTAKQIFVVR